MDYGRYTVIEKLGDGSMGVVYKATDTRLKREVALKVLHKHLTSDTEYVRRFRNEAIIIARLSHPNIVHVYELEEMEGTFIIVMELLEGRSLGEEKRERRMELPEVLRIGRAIAGALDYAHRRGVVHRDIKPSNVILMPDGEIKITDFGIARVEDPEASKKTRIGEILGTPYYMSPEQVQGNPVDGRTDLYALGVMLFELVTGKPPFLGKTFLTISNAILNNPPVWPERTMVDVPEALAPVILKSLSKTPEERYQTGAEMAAAIDAVPIATEPEPPPKKPSLTHRMRYLALAAILVALVAWGASRFLQPEPETGLLRLTTDPSSAQVFIDGSLKGETPLDVTLPLGAYGVRMVNPSYYPFEAKVTLEKPNDVIEIAETLIRME